MEISTGRSSQNGRSHFVLVPWLAQGHFIPMIDIARLLSGHGGVHVTVITTPGNVDRVGSTFIRLPCVSFFTIPFPAADVGLPDGCDNLEALPSRDFARSFYNAAKLLRLPVESIIRNLSPKPSCIINGIGFPWLDSVARKLGVPRFIFNGFSCFALLAFHNLYSFKTHTSAAALSGAAFVLPGIEHRVEITKARLPTYFDESAEFYDIYRELREGEAAADGVVLNSFEELEPEYTENFEKASGKKVWAIGPVLLSSKETIDIMERGNKPSVTDVQWLDRRKPGSVIYVSFGSMGRITLPQFIELASGLEDSNRPFIWVIKPSLEIEQWLSKSGFEKRNEENCLVIRGWAPQLMILSHEAVGGFLTHCGWNSVLEALSSGVAMITWPLGADQFVNEKLVVEVLSVGVSIGTKAPKECERSLHVVRRETVGRAVETLMGESEEGDERRKKAMEFGEMSRRAIGQNGSSFMNMTRLIEDVSTWSFKTLAEEIWRPVVREKQLI